jgi:hypothetical protein
MTLSEFNSMSLKSQSEMLWEWGFYIANSKKGNTNTILFLLGELTVEMNINILENKPEAIKAVQKEQLQADLVSAMHKNKPLIGKRIFELEEICEAA